MDGGIEIDRTERIKSSVRHSVIPHNDTIDVVTFKKEKLCPTIDQQRNDRTRTHDSTLRNILLVRNNLLLIDELTRLRHG